MKEYGSDFHSCAHDFLDATNFLDVMGCTRMYSCGRHAIDAIVKHRGWKRIWMPAYFCYEVMEHLRNHFEVVLYDDSPLNTKDDEVVCKLPYKEGDVLLRTDYFGFRKYRTNEGIGVPVIEDHTHGIITDWALRSNADYCIASLRKSLPVAAGGILWSPKGLLLPDSIKASEDCEAMAKTRYDAMKMKAEYLKNPTADAATKDAFREKYLESEDKIAILALSGIDHESEAIIKALNIKMWTDLKTDNWYLCKELLDKRFKVIEPESSKTTQPFSLVILMDSVEEREKLRKYMIQHQIYPAILWHIPENCEFTEAKSFSEKMLSVHCDIRYGRTDITTMCEIINRFYDTDI